MDTFVGAQLGGCDRFDVGQSPSSDYPLEITLEHRGGNGGHLRWARISAGGTGESFECAIDEKLDGDVTKSYTCRRRQSSYTM